MKKLNTGTGPKIAGISTVAAAIIAAVVAVEGGHSNNPKDPGGETIYGVTKNVAVAHGYFGPMRTMPVEYAWSIYYDSYIKKPGYVPMETQSPAVLEELVDTAVNTGVSRSSRWFQQSLNSLSRGGKDYVMVIVDGKVGSSTIDAYVALSKKRGKVPACEMVIKLIDTQQANHYMSLTKLSDFTPGWVAHRIGNVDLQRCSE